MTGDNALDTSTPRPVDNRTLREQVVEHLRDEILSGRLVAGSEVNGLVLARTLGISRGPLREAFGQLAAEGLITMTPRRRAVVTRLTRKDFQDAYQVREALESLAIRLAVPRLTLADKALLHELCQSMDTAAARDDVTAFFRLNRQFHETLVIASDNSKLQELHGLLIAQIGRLMVKSYDLRGGLTQSATEHRAILEAVDAGDAARAAQLMEDHIEVPQRVLDSDAARELFGEPSDGNAHQETNHDG
jgi:DNA-binding GntR family transcriptional regulator